MKYMLMQLDTSMNYSHEVSLFKNENSLVNSHFTVKPPMKAYLFSVVIEVIVIKFSIHPHILYVLKKKNKTKEIR